MKSSAVRYHWIDNVKVFALYLVVLGHVGTSPLHDVIYGFHMPLFFMLSGMLHKDKSVTDVFKRLIIPYLLFNLLYLALETPWLYRQDGNFGFLVNDLWGIVFPLEHPIDYPTWFLLSLFEIKLIIKALNDNTRLACVVSMLFIILCCLFDIDVKAPLFMKNTLIGLCYYCVGHLLHRVFFSSGERCRQYAVCIVGG